MMSSGLHPTMLSTKSAFPCGPLFNVWPAPVCQSCILPLQPSVLTSVLPLWLPLQSAARAARQCSMLSHRGLCCRSLVVAQDLVEENAKEPKVVLVSLTLHVCSQYSDRSCMQHSELQGLC